MKQPSTAPVSASDVENPTHQNNKARHSDSEYSSRKRKRKQALALILSGGVMILISALVLTMTNYDSDSKDNSASDTAGANPMNTPTLTPTTSPPSPNDNSTSTPDPTAYPFPPVFQQLRWVLDAVNGMEDVNSESITARFNDLFRSQISTEDLQGLFQNLSVQNGGRPVVVISTLGSTDFSAVVLIGAAGSDVDEQLQLTILVEDRPPYLISALLLQEPPQDLEVIPQSFADIAQQLQALAPSSTYLVAEIIDGSECQALDGSSNVNTSVPIGSVFKLYVLGAAIDAIGKNALEFEWNDTIPIQDDLKSFPSGTMQNEPAGTEFTILEYAQKMISISDNTATDHLIDWVGRTQVEQALTDLGHTNPNVNIPFLNTVEFFRFKAGQNEEQVAEYLQLNIEEKRRFLANLTEQVALDGLDLNVLSSPRFINDIEWFAWFASPNDICRAFAGLSELAEATDSETEMRSILTIDKTALGDDNTWDFVGYKGGSEAGVIMMAFVADRSDGRRFVQVLSLADEENQVDNRQVNLLALEGFRLLGQVF